MPQPLPQAKPQATSQNTGAEVRRLPPRKTSSPAMQPVVERSAMQASPWKVTGESAASRPRGGSAATGRPGRESTNPANGQSVLRRTSLEVEAVEPAPLNVDSQRAAPIIRGQSPAASDIPHNPLRG